MMWLANLVTTLFLFCLSSVYTAKRFYVYNATKRALNDEGYEVEALKPTAKKGEDVFKGMRQSCLDMSSEEEAVILRCLQIVTRYRFMAKIMPNKEAIRLIAKRSSARKMYEERLLLEIEYEVFGGNIFATDADHQQSKGWMFLKSLLRNPDANIEQKEREAFEQFKDRQQKIQEKLKEEFPDATLGVKKPRQQSKIQKVEPKLKQKGETGKNVKTRLVNREEKVERNKRPKERSQGKKEQRIKREGGSEKNEQGHERSARKHNKGAKEASQRKNESNQERKARIGKLNERRAIMAKKRDSIFADKDFWFYNKIYYDIMSDLLAVIKTIIKEHGTKANAIADEGYGDHDDNYDDDYDYDYDYDNYDHDYEADDAKNTNDVIDWEYQVDALKEIIKDALGGADMSFLELPSSKNFYITAYSIYSRFCELGESFTNKLEDVNVDQIYRKMIHSFCHSTDNSPTPSFNPAVRLDHEKAKQDPHNTSAVTALFQGPLKKVLQLGSGFWLKFFVYLSGDDTKVLDRLMEALGKAIRKKDPAYLDAAAKRFDELFTLLKPNGR